MRRALALAGVVLLAACATTVPDGPVTGSWGGEHVGLTLDSTGGQLEYDCAAGTIAETVIPARYGSFAVNGTHTPGMGGPDRIDYVSPSYPARYTGKVSGETMTMRVSVPSRELTLGPFRLRRGAEPRILRCL
jgi:hypothetical protein